MTAAAAAAMVALLLQAVVAPGTAQNTLDINDSFSDYNFVPAVSPCLARMLHDLHTPSMPTCQFCKHCLKSNARPHYPLGHPILSDLVASAPELSGSTGQNGGARAHHHSTEPCRLISPVCTHVVGFQIRLCTLLRAQGRALYYDFVTFNYTSKAIPDVLVTLKSSGAVDMALYLYCNPSWFSATAGNSVPRPGNAIFSSGELSKGLWGLWFLCRVYGVSGCARGLAGSNGAAVVSKFWLTT